MIPLHKSGTVAELKVATYFAEEGYDVFFPITMNPKADLIVSKGSETLKVQVKKASWSKTGDYKYLQVRLLGKKAGDYQRVYKLNDFDVLVIVDGDRLWKIPVEDVIGKTSLYLDTTNPNPRKSKRDYDPNLWRV